mmetsp:Transcript_75352/g.118753  ORF Transcript_75352/g.118753 Transcript_75352/m.118753 type:complete len:254 (-) Transcript_75352:1819-2580(-)
MLAAPAVLPHSRSSYRVVGIRRAVGWMFCKPLDLKHHLVAIAVAEHVAVAHHRKIESKPPIQSNQTTRTLLEVSRTRQRCKDAFPLKVEPCKDVLPPATLCRYPGCAWPDHHHKTWNKQTTHSRSPIGNPRDQKRCKELCHKPGTLAMSHCKAYHNCGHGHQFHDSGNVDLHRNVESKMSKHSNRQTHNPGDLLPCMYRYRDCMDKSHAQDLRTSAHLHLRLLRWRGFFLCAHCTTSCKRSRCSKSPKRNRLV